MLRMRHTIEGVSVDEGPPWPGSPLQRRATTWRCGSTRWSLVGGFALRETEGVCQVKSASGARRGRQRRSSRSAQLTPNARAAWETPFLVLADPTADLDSGPFRRRPVRTRPPRWDLVQV